MDDFIEIIFDGQANLVHYNNIIKKLQGMENIIRSQSYDGGATVLITIRTTATSVVLIGDKQWAKQNAS